MGRSTNAHFPQSPQGAVCRLRVKVHFITKLSGFIRFIGYWTLDFESVQ